MSKPFFCQKSNFFRFLILVFKRRNQPRSKNIFTILLNATFALSCCTNIIMDLPTWRSASKKFANKYKFIFFAKFFHCFLRPKKLKNILFYETKTALHKFTKSMFLVLLILSSFFDIKFDNSLTPQH